MTHRNPLFPDSPKSDKPSDAVSPRPQGKKSVIQPLPEQIQSIKGRESAASVIRKKLAAIYAAEPDAKQGTQNLENAAKPLSKHQVYLADLQKSGASIAEIQTKWHEYYLALPEDEKRSVWQEFYAVHEKRSLHTRQPAPHTATTPQSTAAPTHQKAVVSNHDIATPSASRKRLRDARSARDIKQSISDTVTARGKLQGKHHLQSILFGLGTGAVVLAVMMFGLFNEMIIAPLIQPSRNVSATPIIMNGDTMAADGQSKVIIPKINVEIPVDYTLTSNSEEVVQAGLNNGVIHYPSTSKPGEQGNAAFFGHSSNNIFNPGKYKFAFVLLSRLESGDMFYLTHEGKAYAYKIYDKQIVDPADVWVLNDVAGKAATAALITCDPPGTTRHRLVVWGEQVSPDPSTAAPSSTTTDAAPSATSTTDELPGPAPSLWSRLWSWL